MLMLILVSACSRKSIGFKEGLTVDEFDFSYMTAKAKIKYKDKDRNISAAANIRVKKDSLLWMSISPGLGVEVARVKIDRDSLHILDRLNKKYIVQSFSQLSRRLDFDLDYNLIESVVLGNLIFPYSKEELSKSDSQLQYSQTLENFIFENFIGLETKKLEKLEVEDVKTKNVISVNYENFRAIDEEIFPFTIQAKIDYSKQSQEDIEIDIGFSKAEIQNDPLSFPFRPSSKFKRL